MKANQQAIRLAPEPVSPVEQARALFRDSVRELKDTRSLVLISLLLALQVVLRMFLSINLLPYVRISFSFLVTALSGALFGPFVAMTVSALSDVLAFFLGGATATGPFFPGYTLTAALGGLIYGFSFYRRKISLIRLAITYALVSLALNLGLNTLWMSVQMGQAYRGLLPMRALKAVCQTPFDLVLLLPLLDRAQQWMRASVRR